MRSHGVAKSKSIGVVAQSEPIGKKKQQSGLGRRSALCCSGILCVVVSGGLFPLCAADAVQTGSAAFGNIGHRGKAVLLARERIQLSLNMPQTDPALRPLAQRPKQLARTPRPDPALSDLGEAGFPDCLTDT